MDKEPTKSYSINDIKHLSICVPIGELSVTGHFGSLVRIEPAISIWIEASRNLLPTSPITLDVKFLIGDIEITGKYQLETKQLDFLSFIQWLTAMIAGRLSVLEVATNRAAEVHLEQKYIGGMVRVVRDNKHFPGRSHREYHLEKTSWSSRIRLLNCIYGQNWLYTYQDMAGNLHLYEADQEYIVNEFIRLSRFDLDQIDTSRQYMDQANALEALANLYKRWPIWAARLQTYLLRYYARLTLPGTQHYVQKAAIRLFEVIEPEIAIAALNDVSQEMNSWQHQMNLLRHRLQDKLVKPLAKAPDVPEKLNTLDILTLQSPTTLRSETNNEPEKLMAK